MSVKAYIQRINYELIIWPTALILLFLMDPYSDNGPGFCMLKRIGITWCPGCGMGHSISFLLHGQWKASLQAHFLGPFALPLLTYRIFQLGRAQWQSFAELKNHYT
ncbi:DUF2752 domain-containing protein [Chitinophaga rhizophila]|uniref:DUF2752 domain-containing protein n=1 Tax=Chitinophaga rhizophila TaxID=2866212 RepID=A0ABS7GEB8_9BACT|nr:DUF2752 domain-containing protein [Chitinophaga rhizophila]MBW8686013.1 DUF2752 domain-containing protein [Chitinophaga rhizophila]